MGNIYYGNGTDKKLLSGIAKVPRLTLAQYNALTVKPEFWIRTDAPESYKKLSADQVSYDSNTTVKDKLDQKNGISLFGTYTKSASVETGNFPDKPFIATAYGSGVVVSLFCADRSNLGKFLYLDSTHRIYFNNVGTFSLSDVENGTTVEIYQIN